MVSGGVQNCAFAHLKVSVAGQCHAFAYLKASVAVSPQAHHYSIAVLCMIWNVLDHQNMQHKGGGGTADQHNSACNLQASCMFVAPRSSVCS